MSCAAQTAGNTGSEDQLGCGVATQRAARLLVSVRVAYTAEITMWFSVVGRLEPVVSAGALAWVAVQARGSPRMPFLLQPLAPTCRSLTCSGGNRPPCGARSQLVITPWWAPRPYQLLLSIREH